MARDPDQGAAGGPRSTAPAWTVAPAVAFGAALLFATLLSTQFLAQPFVWRHWPWEEVLEGWLFVWRDRLVVALILAALLVAVGRVRVRSLAARTGLLAASVLTGALCGELLLHAIDGRPGASGLIAGATARWSLMAATLAAMFYLWRSAAETHELAQREQLRGLRTEQQLAGARLGALRSQIEPHFLFNTLATVRRLQRTGPEEGNAMLSSFVGYLRHTLTLLDRSEVRLDAELELVEAYLAVIRVRMSGRLQVQVDVPPTLHGLLVPPLALATLVENAIKHGLAPATDGGTLSLQARVLGETVELGVTDDGVGLAAGANGGTGLGLSNLRARLLTLHGRAATLRLAAHPPQGVRATLRLPLRLGGAGAAP